ncbi:MAG: V-type ATP synthase subunit D [Gemmatimonadota bacterium]|nr:MAG: V-type ATP synthase subunit D [Gemmatimonadota bacterium]
MVRLKLSKASLQQERQRLTLYEKLLPSLELKRRQLTIELDKAREEYAATRAEVESIEARVGAELPMLAATEIDLKGLVMMTALDLEQENVVGVRLPLVKHVECRVAEYSMLAKPAWVDALVERLRDAAEARTRIQVAAERVRILERAERRITQRVNLFDKILIPRTRKNIQRIRIWLGDQERTAVVQAKLAKARQEGRTAWPSSP